jgi:hypothetical protein
MLTLGCLGYYSLSHYNYYPGVLKKILWAIPIFITSFFVYATIEWKHLYFEATGNIEYVNSMIDWQTHLIVSVMAFYIVTVAIFKYKSADYFLSGFWSLVLLTHVIMFGSGIDHNISSTTETFFEAMQIWIIPVIILHFVKDYTLKIKLCDLYDSVDCIHNVKLRKLLNENYSDNR